MTWSWRSAPRGDRRHVVRGNSALFAIRREQCHPPDRLLAQGSALMTEPYPAKADVRATSARRAKRESAAGEKHEFVSQMAKFCQAASKSSAPHGGCLHSKAEKRLVPFVPASTTRCPRIHIALDREGGCMFVTGLADSISSTARRPQYFSSRKATIFWYRPRQPFLQGGMT